MSYPRRVPRPPGAAIPTKWPVVPVAGACVATAGFVLLMNKMGYMEKHKPKPRGHPDHIEYEAWTDEVRERLRHGEQKYDSSAAAQRRYYSGEATATATKDLRRLVASPEFEAGKVKPGTHGDVVVTRSESMSAAAQRAEEEEALRAAAARATKSSQ